MNTNLPTPPGRGFRLGDDDTSSEREDFSKSGSGSFWNSTSDRYDDPDYWEGTLSRRFIAYLIDILVLTGVWIALWIILIFSLGLLAPLTALAWAFAPVIYHTLMVSQYGATIGQRTIGLEVKDPETGQNPHILQALLLTILFYGSILTLAGVPLLYALFDDRNRLLHDLLTRTRTIQSVK